MHSAAADPVVNPGPVGIATGEQSGARWRTDGRRRIAVGKTDTVRGQSVQVGRLDDFVPVTGQITVPKIVAQHDHNVRAFRDSVGGSGENGKQASGDGGCHFHESLRS